MGNIGIPESLRRGETVAVTIVADEAGGSGGLTDDELRATPVPVSGTVTADLNPLTGIASGQKTVTSAGTAEALAGSTACKSVTIKALHDNTNMVYVGTSTVDSTNGFVLDAGETVSMDIDNLADVYIDVDTNSEGVSYIYVT